MAIYGTEGNDTIRATGDGEMVLGRGGDDNITGTSGKDYIIGDGGDDTIRGGGNDDFIYGGDGDDRVYGEGGDDFIRGDGGDDFMIGGSGSDTLDGGAGDDTVSYASSDTSVAYDLSRMNSEGYSMGIGGDAAGDMLRNVENITGSARDDFLAGNDATNEIRGGSGSDMLVGRAGDDRLYGGAGSDILLGGAGRDVLDGGAGDDSYYFTYEGDGYNRDTVSDSGVIDSSDSSSSNANHLYFSGGDSFRISDLSFRQGDENVEGESSSDLFIEASLQAGGSYEVRVVDYYANVDTSFTIYNEGTAIDSTLIPVPTTT